MRLIDADKFEVYPYTLTSLDFEAGVLSVLEKLDAAPTIDAMPVVRCKDCKYHHWEQEPCHGKTVHYCELPHMRGVEVFKEFFCYYGKRKDGDGNG